MLKKSVFENMFKNFSLSKNHVVHNRSEQKFRMRTQQ